MHCEVHLRIHALDAFQTIHAGHRNSEEIQALQGAIRCSFIAYLSNRYASHAN